MLFRVTNYFMMSFFIIIERFMTWEIEIENGWKEQSALNYYHVRTLQDCQTKCINEQKIRCLSVVYDYGRCALYQTVVGDMSRDGHISNRTNYFYSELKGNLQYIPNSIKRLPSSLFVSFFVFFVVFYRYPTLLVFSYCCMCEITMLNEC